jgi:fido (protein-threonine AMPylation protein)
MKHSTTPKDATSYKETAFGIIPRDKLVEKELEGIGRGLEYIGNQISLDVMLNPEFLLELHRVCFEWIFPSWAGKYRTIKVQTSSHEFPHHSQVPILVTDFFRDLNERMKHDFDPIEIVAWTQHRIALIHPFQDYNGRIARLFSSYLMRRFDLPPAVMKFESEEQRSYYIKTLKLADHGDLIPLQNLIRDAIPETNE